MQNWTAIDTSDGIRARLAKGEHETETVHQQTSTNTTNRFVVAPAVKFRSGVRACLASITFSQLYILPTWPGDRWQPVVRKANSPAFAGIRLFPKFES